MCSAVFRPEWNVSHFKKYFCFKYIIATSLGQRRRTTDKVTHTCEFNDLEPVKSIDQFGDDFFVWIMT